MEHAFVKRTLPNLLVVFGYIGVWFLLLSAVTMWGMLVLGYGELSKVELRGLIGPLYYVIPFYKPPLGSGMIFYMLLCGGYLWGVWAISTRVTLSNQTLRRRALCFLLPVLTFVLIFGLVSVSMLKPVVYDTLLKIDTTVEAPEYRAYLHPESLRMYTIFLMCIPMIVMYLFLMRLWSEYKSDETLQEWFESYQFEVKWLGRFGDAKINEGQDLSLARNVETGAPAVLSGESRQLGTILVGPPGSGKTSLKITKAIEQDLAHLQRAINAYPAYVRKYGYQTEAFWEAWGKHLTGIVVIEPAQDLCDDAYALCKDFGIPDELIVYIDPTKPHTPGFNVMVGPIEQVAETITAVLEGMSESSDEFFRQSARTVLKQYIYLLKFLKKDNCTLLDLDRMYQDPRYTADLVEQLENKLPSPEEMMAMSGDKKIYWTIAERTVQWFWTDGIELERDRAGMVMKYDDGPHQGRVRIRDKQFEFTRTTRNLLSDLITNPYLSRVLVNKNQVDFDKLMARGGVLLCNAAKGELQNVSKAFGKMVLMSAQMATFRRPGTEKTRPLVALYVDEFYDYMNLPFLDLASQGRKYKVAPFVACQTLAQFDITFGRGFTQGMLGTIRNYIVYGGVSSYDAEMFSKVFGTAIMEDLQTRESYSPETMANPHTSYTDVVSRKEMELVTPDEIMYNKFKFSYLRLVINRNTTKAFKAEGDFINRDNPEKWRKRLNPKAVSLFLEDWRKDFTSKQVFQMDWIDKEKFTEEINMPESSEDVTQIDGAPAADGKPVTYITAKDLREEGKFVEMPRESSAARYHLGPVSPGNPEPETPEYSEASGDDDINLERGRPSSMEENKLASPKTDAPSAAAPKQGKYPSAPKVSVSQLLFSQTSSHASDDSTTAPDVMNEQQSDQDKELSQPVLPTEAGSDEQEEVKQKTVFHHEPVQASFSSDDAGSAADHPPEMKQHETSSPPVRHKPAEMPKPDADLDQEDKRRQEVQKKREALTARAPARIHGLKPVGHVSLDENSALARAIFSRSKKNERKSGLEGYSRER